MKITSASITNTLYKAASSMDAITDNSYVTPLLVTLAVVLAIKFLPRFFSSATYVIPEQVAKKMDDGEDIVVIDVRTESEFIGSLGHIKGAINLPLGDLNSRLENLSDQLEPYKNEPVYAVCRTANRSAIAAGTLKKAGFEDVRVMSGGMIRWARENRPTEGAS